MRTSEILYNIMKMNNIVNEIINDKLPARKEEDRQYEITKNNKTGIVEQVEATDDDNSKSYIHTSSTHLPKWRL